MSNKSKYEIIQDVQGVYEQGFYIVIDETENKPIGMFQFKKEANSYVKEVKEKGIDSVDITNHNGTKIN